ncbi:type II secretion system protein [Moritella sp.]|uniref:type II secretion system protein n=1 Tax=Moritella sp. TaxID=78556 RepID=UPI001D71B33D|nr:type II secretion system protein [Moritella sp.]MCJ8350069.1 type II secretion system GspH family protein [Moritella sp.]NQZ39638.1 type II secretion system protein [Moritella sp.]
MKFVNKNQGGFTLLELLVVVGIIAIIGGAMLSSFSGQEATAARGVATSAIAGIEDATRIYRATTKGTLPNNMESLVCANYDAAGTVSTSVPSAADGGVLPATAAATTSYKYGGTSNASGIGGGMTKKLAAKFDIAALTALQATALNDVGITSMRYAISEACDTDVTTTASIFALDGTTSVDFGDGGEGLVGIDIPNQAFEGLRPDGQTGYKFRGIGFAGTIETASPVLIWKKGDGGYNNIKLGAAESDVLIAMGVGQASDLVGTGPNAAFSKAPFYGQVGKDKYAHYIALINVGPAGDEFTNGETQVQAVVDARGDFLDEEIAEFNGQKI